MDSKPTTATDIRKQFEKAGFEVLEAGQTPATLEVKKNKCTQRLEPLPDGGWAPAGPPQFTVRGMKCRLEDRGYQKFWYSDGRRFPIRKIDLATLHRFDEEVRGILGVKSLYNESLGTTCARSAYDRLTGRTDS